MRTAEDKELIQRVNNWARENAVSDFNYGSRYSYWATAKHKGIISDEELERGKEMYGNLWHYRGD